MHLKKYSQLLLFFQVHPYKLTHAMFERACSRGVELIKGKLTGIVFGENDKKPKVKGKLLNIIKEPFVTDAYI